MTIDFNCPHCATAIHAPNNAAGMSGTCLNCKEKIQVPSIPQQPSRLSSPSQLQQSQPTTTAHQMTVETAPVGIKVYCPQCQKKYGVYAADEGKRFRCTNCGTYITIPVALNPSMHAAVSDSHLSNNNQKPANHENRNSMPPPPRNHRSWHVQMPNGQQYGPIDRSTLEGWIADERLPPDTCVWCDGWEDWKTLSEVFPNSNAPPIVSPRSVVTTIDTRQSTHLNPSRGIHAQRLILLVVVGLGVVSYFLPIVVIPLVGGINYFSLIGALESNDKARLLLIIGILVNFFLDIVILIMALTGDTSRALGFGQRTTVALFGLLGVLSGIYGFIDFGNQKLLPGIGFYLQFFLSLTLFVSAFIWPLPPRQRVNRYSHSAP